MYWYKKKLSDLIQLSALMTSALQLVIIYFLHLSV